MWRLVPLFDTAVSPNRKKNILTTCIKNTYILSEIPKRYSYSILKGFTALLCKSCS